MSSWLPGPVSQAGSTYTVAMGADEQHSLTVVSFVRRAGRLTPSQARALPELWPQFGVESGADMLEMGFGNSEVLVELARRHPENDYLGLAAHHTSVGHLLLIEKSGLTNIRLRNHDAVGVLQHQLPAHSLDEALPFFTESWPKKRHQERRRGSHGAAATDTLATNGASLRHSDAGQ